MQRQKCESLVRTPLLNVSPRLRRRPPASHHMSWCKSFKPSGSTSDLAPRSRVLNAGRHMVRLVAQASAGQVPAGRNLMVAVDSSPDSNYACEWLVNNVYQEGDTVHVVHCIPYYPRSGIYVMPDGRLATLDFDVLLRNEDQFLMAAEKAVSDWCADALEKAKVRYVVELLRERPGAEDKDVVGAAICAKAHDLQAGVVVIASHAKSGISEFLLGSVANYCAHHCESPVLVLHQPKESGQQKEGWLAGVTALLKPRVRAEAVGAAAVGQRAMAAAAQTVDKSGLVSSGDFSSGRPAEDENLFGQTADFPGIGSRASKAFAADSRVQQAQHGAEQAQQQQPQAAQEAAASGEGGSVGSGAQGERHLVLTVDDSDTSERACLWAAQNLYHPGDRVHLLHIIPAMPYRWGAASSSPYRSTYGGGGTTMDGFIFYMEPPTEDFKKATELYVGKRFVSKLEAMGIQPEVDIITERADESVSGIGGAICKHVEALAGEAVVVVGSHVRGGLAEFMLGSVATYLTHHCTKPVAVLH